LQALSGRWALDIHVAHYDHRLREESSADAAFVARTARRLGVAFTGGSADPGERPRGLSPEEAARERRLRFLEEVANTYGCARIATGHTLDDQAETVLMRLLTGAGTRGLSGIPPVREPYVRPLIDRRREDVEEYCRALRLRPRRDPTNSSPDFLRNVIRAELLPLAATRVNGRVAEALARASDAFRDDEAALEDIAGASVDIVDGTIPLRELNALHPALRRRVLRLAAGSLTADHVEAVLALAAGGKSGDAIDLPQGLNARLEYGSLVLGRRPSPAPPLHPVPLVVPGRTEVGSWGAVITALDGARPRAWPDGKERCVVDLDRLDGPVIVRARRRGDRIRPLGMAGTRAVSDILAEAKILRAARDRVPVVAAGSRLVWIVGHGIADDVKVTETTRRFLWMSAEGGPE
jgi:tRNA(Ile)-lysidine synthase